MIDQIYNYLPFSEKLATSGQPTEDQIKAISDAGFEIVINLALHDTEYSLPDEEATVADMGMHYIHIPVEWENPTHVNLLEFFDAMEKNTGRAIFIHCAANMRVSIFLALYRLLREGWSLDEVERDIAKIWVPNSIWKEFFVSYTSGELSFGGENTED